ncbi:hypothetical protein DFH09DRAFT_1321730 [Mycena vulgaris]|nr:hypothetical protein DFH09DRAFT_1321730 [Mycena vulgaris]
MSFIYDWGLPAINVPPPASRDGYGPNPAPLPWNSLQFSPIGLYDLRRRLGVLPREPGIFQRYQSRFIASDLAWFVADASVDNKHIPPTPNSFFPEFNTLRDTVPTGPTGAEARKSLNKQIGRLVFDMATCWDRLFGGTTMILHIEGTTVPNTPPLPQYLRCATYLPPSFIADNPASHASIARIAQLFIESVGVPTVQKWRNNANRRGWPLTQPGPVPMPNTNSPILIPQPDHGTTHYKFKGRPIGGLDTILPPVLPVVIIPDEDDFDDAIMDAMERAGYAEAEALEYLRRIEELEAQEAILIERVASLEDLTDSLHAQLSTLTRPTRGFKVRLTSPHAPPSFHSAARSQPATPTRVQPSTSRRPPPPHDNENADMETFIMDPNNGLEDHAGSIRLLIRLAHAAKWYEELLDLGIEPAMASAIVDVAAANGFGQ